jgi:hypothetical protein
MTDPVLEALRKIVPVTRGQVNLGGRMLRWIESGAGTPAPAAPDLLGCARTARPDSRGHP